MNESFNSNPSPVEKKKSTFAVLKERREKVFRNMNLKNDEIIDQMQEIDQLRISTELDYMNINSDFSNEDLGEIESHLLNVTSKDFYTEIQPETNVYHKMAGKDLEEENALCLTLDGMNVLGDGKIRFSIRVTEPYKKGDFHVEHAGIIEVDVTNNRVHSILAPEGIAIERPRTLRPAYAELKSLTQNAMHALSNLLEPTKHNPSSYKEGNKEGDSKKNEERLTKIEREKMSTLKCRKRTFHRMEDLDSLPEKLISLEESWSEQERAVLTEAVGDNKVRFSVFIKERGGKYSELDEQPTLQDAVSLQSELGSLFVSGKIDSVTLICKGTWVDRYLRNLEPAPSPTGHTRRLTGKIILVLPQNANSDLRSLQEKIKANGINGLNQDEKEDLKTLLATDEEGLLNVFSKGGVVYKSDTFSSGASVGNPVRPNDYYYTKGVERGQQERDAA